MPNLIEYIKGSATTEQDLVLALEDFMINVLTGWSVVDKNTDTASDRDYIFYSRGVEVGKYRDLYIRWRGYDDNLDIYGYQRWVDSGDYDAELNDVSGSRVNCGSGPFTYWIFGDNDGVWVIIKSGSTFYHAYGGYLETYFCDSDDDIPLCIVGQPYDSTFFDSNSLLAYGPPTAASGTNTSYSVSATIFNNYLTYGEPNQRDGSTAHIPVVMVHTTITSQYELRGELKHALWFAGESISSEDWITISGTDYKYFINKYDSTKTLGFGPVSTTSGEW
ncbi:MAG: hypothetical protein KAS32_31085 [Candidatus Peribacteraceae bacterium]|nr:hypothetical protein [Candidatus Peribacteraceae bacterium]